MCRFLGYRVIIEQIECISFWSETFNTSIINSTIFQIEIKCSFINYYTFYVTFLYHRYIQRNMPILFTTSLLLSFLYIGKIMLKYPHSNLPSITEPYNFNSLCLRHITYRIWNRPDVTRLNLIGLDHYLNLNKHTDCVYCLAAGYWCCMFCLGTGL